MKKLLIIALSIVLLVGCSNKSSADDKTVKVGMIGTDSVVWKYVVEEAAKEGITIELISFSDYTQPNAALDSGEIDLNSFQHRVYLENEIETHGYKLSSIGNTTIAPLGLYSKKITDLAELKDGDKIGIPNDVTNGGRALQLLQANGLIKINDEKFPTLKDVVENPRNFEIIELAAVNIPGSLDDLAIAAINSGIATDAGMNPKESSIVLEQVDITQDNPYVNLIVARTSDKDNEVYKRIVEIYHTDKVKELTIEDSKGALIPVW